jgi:hypothetical protein
MIRSQTGTVVPVQQDCREGDFRIWLSPNSLARLERLETGVRAALHDGLWPRISVANQLVKVPVEGAMELAFAVLKGLLHLAHLVPRLRQGHPQ